MHLHIKQSKTVILFDGQLQSCMSDAKHLYMVMHLGRGQTSYFLL